MLEKSDYPIARALEILAEINVEAAFLVPTFTGLQKSIFDATNVLREYLTAQNYHNYSVQGQGQDYKAQQRAFLVHENGLEPTTVSLYRPITKKGDPRIWLGNPIRGYAQSNNLLAVTIVSGTMYILNMSDRSVRLSLENKETPFRKVVEKSNNLIAVSDELLDLLRGISKRGFVRTLRKGDTGVGFTLETLLGIEANCSREPDYKGIEIKSKRSKIGKGINRSTLFSQVPNWKLSPVRSAQDLLTRRGYLDQNGRLSLYHTLSATKPNSLGLALVIDPTFDWLKQIHINPQSRAIEHDVTWEIPSLKENLAKKHKETFWVRALCRGSDEHEEFHYVEVQHTRRAMVSNIPTLIEAGIITVDYTMNQFGGRVRDHGYLFKINPNDLGAMFPPPKLYRLC
ncbi:MvaI/BcnI family restriction endonuclease [Acetobacter indonesiensis]|uniref:MvaI/BcnI family restriction endonuclease n=1 Tax=Acetobacter indonesiensis TaxID=104101 RepID=UPI0020A34B6D|nr:MvaI/BcnI family restriction endonuclease [Acetobacter indonesiensis]MCP1232036.1 MvaI/BcnI family restriction endonuclease [Acetobacter indonesiensis]